MRYACLLQAGGTHPTILTPAPALPHQGGGEILAPHQGGGGSGAPPCLPQAGAMRLLRDDDGIAGLEHDV